MYVDVLFHLLIKKFLNKMTVYPDYNLMEVLARIALTAGNKRARPRI